MRPRTPRRNAICEHDPAMTASKTAEYLGYSRQEFSAQRGKWPGFPESFQISPTSNPRWRLSDVNAWLDGRQGK